MGGSRRDESRPGPTSGPSRLHQRPIPGPNAPHCPGRQSEEDYRDAPEIEPMATSLYLA